MTEKSHSRMNPSRKDTSSPPGASHVRLRTGQPGWLLRPATSRMPYWCDVCQIGDAMFVPFVEALKARFAHRAADIEARACLRTGLPLIALDLQHGGADTRVDTGLRVFGNPVWRYQASGICVCETLAGDHIVLIYEPGALTRRVPLQEKEEQT
jgi:hypothetical protein